MATFNALGDYKLHRLAMRIRLRRSHDSTYDADSCRQCRVMKRAITELKNRERKKWRAF